MKKTNKFRKLIFTLIILFISSTSFAQINFDYAILKILEGIAYKTTYQNIIQAFKSSNYILKLSEKKDDGSELLTFKITESNDCTIAYSENKKLIYIKIIFRIDQLAANNCVAELKKNSFKQSFDYKKDTETKIGLKYTKDGYPYEFSLWSIGDYNEGVYLFNPEFGALNKFINYEKEFILHGNPFKKNVQDLYKLKGNNNKVGFINIEGKEIIPSIYDDALEFSEGLAVVSLNKKYGFINQTGKVVVPIIYDEANSFLNGSALIKTGAKYAFINNPETIIIPSKYDFSKIATKLENLLVKNKCYFINDLSACYQMSKVIISEKGEIVITGSDKACNIKLFIKDATITFTNPDVLIKQSSTKMYFKFITENGTDLYDTLNELKKTLNK